MTYTINAHGKMHTLVVATIPSNGWYTWTIYSGPHKIKVEESSEGAYERSYEVGREALNRRLGI